MPNMSHCRFHNTLRDLEDCLENLDDARLSPSEEKARKRLVEVCRQIVVDAELLGILGVNFED